LIDWLTIHEEDLGLNAGLAKKDLELVAAPGFRQSMGGLTIFRFRQTYRGIPVLPPDDLVQLVHGPDGAIQLSGRIVDGRENYAHVASQASANTALRSIRHHTHVRTQIPETDIVVDGPALVALPEARAVVWMGQARHVGGASLARVLVDADPTFLGSVLPLLSYRRGEVDNLAQTQAVQVRSVDPASDPAMPSTSVSTTLFDGQPLLGSVEGMSGDIQLATEAVVVLDLDGGSRTDLDTVGLRVLDPAGDFLDAGGAGLSAQIAHHVLHGWYTRIDGYLTDPFAGAKRWDSAHPVYFMPPGTPSPTPSGTFAPRMLAFVNVASSDCDASAVACANWAGYGPGSLGGMAFPEVVHQPPGASSAEVTGRMLIPLPGDNITTLAHEFGHLVDLFAGPGLTTDLAPDCGGACVSECIEDTSDEAPPLTETIAQMFGMALWLTSFETVDFEYCSIVDAFSRSGTNPWNPGPCVPPGEDVSEFARPGACTKPADYCDKPTDPGFVLECCDPAVDADCIVQAPTDCPATGFQRQIPTGLCHTSPGYDTHSLMQAWWQLLNGRRCDATAPFDCQASAWPLGIEPVDAVLPAFLYSLRLNPLSYEQLFDGMATYMTCSYGDEVYSEFNAIVCAHGLRDCAAPAPIACDICGNGVREGSETCDGMDWVLADCTDWASFVGGTLQCDALTCQLDFSQCAEGGADTTAGANTSSGTDATVGATTGASDSSGGAMGGGGGCGCRTHRPHHFGGAWPLALLVGLRVRRTRRRR